MRHGFVAAGLGLALAGCANLAQINGFATGPAGVRASPCEVGVAGATRPRDMFKDTRLARMTTGDGGWCGWAVRLVDDQGAQHDWMGASIARAPSHGEVRVRLEGQMVHIEYRAVPGDRGPDAFAVRLNPGFAMRRAEVDVVAPAPGPAAPETVITSTRQITEPGNSRWY
jgi:hypothetical protein